MGNVWLQAIGGGLRGLGTVLERGEEEQREARGLALREAYLRGRMHLQNTFTAEQNRATRLHREKLHDETIAAADDRLDRTIAGQDARAAAQIEAANTRSANEITSREGISAAQIASRELIAANRLEADKDDRLQRAKQQVAKLERSLDSPELYSDLADIYYQFDADGNKVANDNLITRAFAVHRKDPERRWPWQITISASDILQSMRETEMGMEEVVKSLLDLRFDVPESSVERMRTILD